TDPIERTALRVQHARYLIESLKRHHDALDILRDALGDDPDNLEVARLLEDTLHEVGDEEGLAEFLANRFEDARKRGAREATIDVAMRLGGLLERAGSSDAGHVYKQALAVAPDDRDLLRKVVSNLDGTAPRESAQLMERLLAVETPDNASQLAWQLASMWEQA